MGYSSRYHVASLAAVFLALAVGMLIGAAFGSDVLDDLGRNLEEGLEEDLEEANARIAELEAGLDHQAEFADTVYPTLSSETLPGRNLAIVAFGERPDEALRENIQDALAPTGAQVTQLAVVGEPPDLEDLAELHNAKKANGVSRERQAQAATIRKAGAAIVGGGRFYDRARETLLSSFSGRPGPVNGVIVVRAQPELEGQEAEDAEVLETGLIGGLLSAGRPVVGVERTDSDPSSIEFFDSQGLTTVDHLDLVAGRVALVYALQGAQGNFGVGEDADGLMPALLQRPGATTAP